MSRFINWFNAPAVVDPVLRAGIAHLWFVTIHPFEDGNGRIARAIADMCLAHADGTLDITPWLRWFLSCLDGAIGGAEGTLGAVLNKARMWERINRRPVNERQRLVINRMLKDFPGFLSTSKYAKLAQCSPDTALRDIREMLERRILVQNPGGGRNTSYRLGEPDTIAD